MKGTRTVLGISVGRTHYDGVLLEASGDEYVVVERFSAPREEDALVSPEFSGEPGEVESIPGVTVQLDTTPGGQDSSDFAGADAITESVARESPQHRIVIDEMDRVLQVWLSRTRQLGYDRVDMVACGTEPDIALVSLEQASSAKPSDAPAPALTGPLSWSQKRGLLKKLKQQRAGKIDSHRVGFMPLAPDSPDGEYLALVDTPENPLFPALTKLAQQRWRRHIRPHRIDADVALFAALIRRSLDSEQLSHSALVHVGTDDTQISFFRRGVLLSHERVPTLTVYTEPSTVASRILLLQDSLRIPELKDLYVVDDTPEQLFIRAFREEFEQSTVREFSDLVADLSFEKRTPRGVMSAGQWLATAAAWEFAHEDAANLSRQGESILPTQLKRRYSSIAATAWHTYLALGLLLLAVVGQGYRYQSMTRDAERTEREFAQRIGVVMPGGQSIEEMRAVLTARLDSLSNAQAFARRSVRFMDSLTVGAERWSHFLVDLGAAARSEEGMWFIDMESVRLANAGYVRLEGFAFRQEQVAELSRILDANIEFMAVTREGGRRLFTFLMTAPVPADDPPSKKYVDGWIADRMSPNADSLTVSGAGS